MPVIPIDSVDDPRLDPYRNLKDRHLAHRAGLFLAEGINLVRRLLASDYETQSVLLSDRRAPRLVDEIPPDVPVYVLPEPVVNQVAGFPFHRGVLACGKRRPSLALEDVVGPRDGPLALLICPTISNCENLGGLVRVAAAFGVDALVLGPESCDPLTRQALRVSMGTALCLPSVRSTDMNADLRRLRHDFGVTLVAAVLDDDAIPLEQVRRPARFGLLLSNEGHGLDAGSIDACDTRVTIPMQLGTDSLNVAVAAGVLLYHVTRVAGKARISSMRRAMSAGSPGPS